MASLSLRPYNYKEVEQLNYEFTNRDGFFQKVENAMIMVCDNTDGKQHKRRSLFSRWFHHYNDGTMATLNAEAGQGDYELLLSLYFKKDNPNKLQIVKAFSNLLTRDLYEIII